MNRLVGQQWGSPPLEYTEVRVLLPGGCVGRALRFRHRSPWPRHRIRPSGKPCCFAANPLSPDVIQSEIGMLEDAHTTLLWVGRGCQTTSCYHSLISNIGESSSPQRALSRCAARIAGVLEHKYIKYLVFGSTYISNRLPRKAR